MVYMFKDALASLSAFLRPAPLPCPVVIVPEPIRKSKPRKRIPRGRYLLPVEWQRVRRVLDAHPVPKVRAYFYVLILEAPRRSEAQKMEWVHVDIAEGLWYKPMTKNGRSQTLALSPQSCTILNSLPRAGRYVFPGEDPNRPWSHTAIEHAWRKIRIAASVEDVQIRDLRRTCASWLTMQGESLITVKEILHHSSVSVTQIYARVDQRHIRAALTKHAEKVMAI